MLLRQKPSEDDCIKADAKLNNILQRNNFYPKYWYKGYFYYINSYELQNFIKKGCEKDV